MDIITLSLAKKYTDNGVGGLDAKIIKSNNLLDESTAVHGSWWTKYGLESSQYTTQYHAYEVEVAGLDSVAIYPTRDESAINNPLFYNYFWVYENGTSSSENLLNIYGGKVLSVPSGAVKCRFNFKQPTADYKVMVNAGTERLPYEPYFEPYTVSVPLRENVSVIRNIIYPRIVLSNTLHAVAGDTIQVFYNGLFDGDIGNLHIMFKCAKGKNYPRYWEYTPSASDVGSYPITVALLSNAGDVIAEKTSNLVVVAAENPSSSVNVLCVGDSTMESGQIPIEASRRIKGTVGATSTPAALAMTNINFVGRKTNDDGTVGWEGTGGWTYGSYNISGYTAIRFTVSDATDLDIGAVYQVGNFKLTISEINVTDGVGNVRCLFYYATPYTSAFDSTAQSGVMTRVSSNGQESVNYTAWAKETYQPFWDADSNAWDIEHYRDTYCNGHIDVICVLLGINSLISASPFTNVSQYVNDSKTLLRNIHNDLPNCKIVVSTLPKVSPNGGIAANYGAASAIGAYSAGVKNRMVADYNLALIDMAESNEFSPYVVLANSHAQFDAENGYPTTTKALNTRTTTTEKLQSNGVHPSNSGYWQLSDALAFRSCIYAMQEV